MYDLLRVKLYRFMRIGSLLAWAGIWAVMPDVDHLVDGAARQTHPFSWSWSYWNSDVDGWSW